MKGLIAPPTLLALRSLSFAYFVQAVGALSVVGCLQQISQEWLLTDTQSAYLISLFGITFALAAPLLQFVLGHLPRRRQVLLGLGLFSSASLLFALAPNYGVLVLARVLMGLGAGFIGPVLGALGSALVDRAQQGRAIAIVLLGLSVAGMAGIPLAAWIAQHWGVRSLYLMLSVAGLMTALLIARFVPDHVQGERIAVSTVVSLFTRLGSLSTFLVVFFITSGVFSTYAFLSPIICDVYHGGPEDVSVALAVLGIAGVAGNLFVTRAAGRYSAEHMLLSGISLLAVTLLLLGYGPARLGWLLPVLVLWGIRYGHGMAFTATAGSRAYAGTTRYRPGADGFLHVLRHWIWIGSGGLGLSCLWLYGRAKRLITVLCYGNCLPCSVIQSAQSRYSSSVNPYERLNTTPDPIKPTVGEPYGYDDTQTDFRSRLPFLLDLRRRALVPHEVAAGMQRSEEEHTARVRAHLESGQLVLLGNTPIGLIKVVKSDRAWTASAPNHPGATGQRYCHYPGDKSVA